MLLSREQARVVNVVDPMRHRHDVDIGRFMFVIHFSGVEAEPDNLPG